MRREVAVDKCREKTLNLVILEITEKVQILATILYVAQLFPCGHCSFRSSERIVLQTKFAGRFARCRSQLCKGDAGRSADCCLAGRTQKTAGYRPARGNRFLRNVVRPVHQLQTDLQTTGGRIYRRDILPNWCWSVPRTCSRVWHQFHAHFQGKSKD